MTIQELMEKRAKAIADARAILDGAESEERDLTDDENKRYDKFIIEAGELKGKIDRESRQQELERELAASDAANPENRSDPQDRENRDQSALQLAGFRNWLGAGAAGAANADADAFQEYRALSSGVDTEGGFLVAPETFVNELIRFVDDEVFIRQWATTHQVAGSASLGAPSLDTDPDDAEWTTELATGNEDSAMKFGKRELTPHPFAKRIKVSNDLLRRSPQPIEQLIRERLGYKFAVTEEKGFLIGTGAGQALGVFTPSNDGIPVARDVSTGNTTTAMTFDGLKEAKYSLKGPHRRSARWMFHRDGIKQLAKIKDGDGQYIWQRAVTAGEPDMLLQSPVFESEFVPNTFTTGLYVGIYGDFKHYWIADDIQMQMQRLAELYAETNQTGFIGRAAADGMPVLAEAFARVKLG